MSFHLAQEIKGQKFWVKAIKIINNNISNKNINTIYFIYTNNTINLKISIIMYHPIELL